MLGACISYLHVFASGSMDAYLFSFLFTCLWELFSILSLCLFCMWSRVCPAEVLLCLHEQEFLHPLCLLN